MTEDDIHVDDVFEIRGKITVHKNKLEIELDSLKKAAMKAEAEKKRILDNFCIDQATDAETEAAQKVFDAAAAQVRHSDEMLQTVVKKIGVAEQGTVKILDTVRKFQGEVWQQLVPDIEKHLVKKVGKDLILLMAANMRQRGAWAYEPLLSNLFPKPSRDQLDAFSGTLDARFEKATRI